MKRSPLPREDDEAFAELVEEVLAVAPAIFSRYRVPVSETADLLQNAFLAYLLRREDVRQPKAYVVAVLHYQCQRYQQQSRTMSEGSFEVLSDFVPSLPPPQLRVEAAVDLRRALAVVPPRPRALLLARVVAGSADAARATGYAPESIRTIRRRSLGKLRAFFRCDGLSGAARAPGARRRSRKPVSRRIPEARGPSCDRAPREGKGCKAAPPPLPEDAE